MRSSRRCYGNSRRGPIVVSKEQHQSVEETSMSSPQDRTAFGQRDLQSEQRTVVPTQQARQGVTGHNVRYVLGIGLAAVIVAFAVLYAIYFA
jgi:hypothetical protein